MVDAPGAIPETTLPVLIEATEALLLDHTPPTVASASVTVDPAHMVLVPVMGDTVIGGLTTKVVLATPLHPPLLAAV